eukprot:6498592-Pyramimonas_sp.AAC.1
MVCAAGRFSSQPGVMIRRRNKLTTMQRCTAVQNEGQCVATVTQNWPRMDMITVRYVRYDNRHPLTRVPVGNGVDGISSRRIGRK